MSHSIFIVLDDDEDEDVDYYEEEEEDEYEYYEEDEEEDQVNLRKPSLQFLKCLDNLLLILRTPDLGLLNF